MKIKVTERLWQPLAEGLFERQDVETAGVLLAEAVDGGLIVRSACLVPEGGYEIRRHDQLRISPITLNRMTRPARDRGWAVLTVHTHPGAEDAWFSWADDQGDARLMPSLAMQMPGVPHGSIVLTAPHRGIARVFFEGTVVKAAKLDIIGRAIVPIDVGSSLREEAFGRQTLALGEHGQRRLRHLNAAVVGLGGTGSAVAVQLFHLGVGTVTLMDGDKVELTNAPRIFGARRIDVGRLKVEVVSRYAEELYLGTKVATFPVDLDNESLKHLASADVIFSCVDRHSPRELLNRFAYEKVVPVIDMGTAFRVDPESGRMIGDAGRVVVVGPGRPCLACWGHIDPDALRVETMPEVERSKLAAEGYVQGLDVPQPSVIAFNAQVASAAVVELMRLVTAFAGADDPPQRLAFSFREGTTRRNRLPDASKCRVCGAETQAT